MDRRRGYCLLFACLIALFFAAQSSAVYGATADDVRTAVGQLDQWLATSGEGPQWRQFLLSDVLEQQLARGQAADRLVVALVLSRYNAYASVSPLSPLVEARRALADWWATLPVPSLEVVLQNVRREIPPYLPPTDIDLQAARQTARQAAARLDERLGRAGAEAEQWRQYFRWDELNKQLQADIPDSAAVERIYRQFETGYEGLGLVWFEDLRESLRRYLAVANAMGRPELESQYQTIIKSLPDQVDAYRRAPSPDKGETVRAIFRWLEDAGQAGPLVEAIRAAWQRPNFYGLASEKLIAEIFRRPVDQMTPVRDCILGTDIHGTGRTLGTVSARLLPASDHAEVALTVDGQTYTNTIGYNGPVQIRATGITSIHTEKRLVATADGISTLPAASSASTRTQINNICHLQNRALSGIIERIAWMQALAQKSEAEQIASRHAEPRASRQTDEEVTPRLAEANTDFQAKFRQPLAERRLFPTLLRFETDADWLYATARAAGRLDLSAGDIPPSWTDSPDAAFQVHETSINNLTEEALGGMRVGEERLREGMTRWLGELPERFRPASEEDRREPLSILFARRLPIAVSFADNGFSVYFRGQSYTRGSRQYPGMNVTARYRIEGAAPQLRAVRQGSVEIFPPGYDARQARRFSVPEQVLRTILERRFNQIFEPEIKLQPLIIKKQTGETVRLEVTQWETANGWLRMAWKLAANPL